MITLYPDSPGPSGQLRVMEDGVAVALEMVTEGGRVHSETALDHSENPLALWGADLSVVLRTDVQPVQVSRERASAPELRPIVPRRTTIGREADLEVVG